MTALTLALHAGANSAAAIAVDGRLIYCVQEERLTRNKGHIGFPREAIAACLRHVAADPADVTAVAYGARTGPVAHCPREEFLRRLVDFHRRPGVARHEVQLLADDSPANRRQVTDALAGVGVKAPVSFYEHHRTHAATAYYGLRADPARPYLVLTCDGFGDGACATITVWRNGHATEVARTDLRNSLGLLYFWTTHAHGFTPHEDEYKLMGMAPHADPGRASQVAAVYGDFLKLSADGLTFRRTTTASVERSWPRIAARLQGRRFDDVFAGLQLFTENLLADWTAAAVAHTGIRDVLAAGGVFMNVKANQRLAALPGVDSFAAFPSCGDESLPLGALYQHTADEYGHADVAPLADCYLGDDITEADAAAALADRPGYHVEHPADPAAAVAALVARGEIVGRAAGRMEFGARALGNRSILADPANPDLPRILNRLVKQRDFWMPFAPAVLASRQHDYLHNPKKLPSPHMMLAMPARADALPEMIAAVHPADLTCRPQIVDDHTDTGLAAILTAYQQATGRGILLNTSLNLHGQPIARTAAGALAVLDGSDLQHLQLGPLLVSKTPLIGGRR
ncbi:carbamoyltransferase [Pilimelia terevasa]|uniref:Carbamoyltransferase n=1 Tax=Pilimelia terevasa TaxID=53372 RepID=A0A8J3FJ18_9ACTN|nr:carbamoyltransferase C-terminal domain-containing protein [Pilimelia terevasa]GGK36348.1 carbamoyltransferase [Pilimelia terevasa]